MKSIRIEDFDLCTSIESGQIFRYVHTPDGYLVHAREKIFWVRQRGHELFFDGVDEEFMVSYFGLGQDYPNIMTTLRKDRTVDAALKRYWGLRILQQDPWECLVSFLCSSAKSIPQIRVILERLCHAFGEPITFGNYQGYAFPTEGAFADPVRLSRLGLGFRAEYLHEVNQAIGKEYFQGLTCLPYERAKPRLMALPGLGEKIADCVLLFSLGFSGAFPVDTWIKRGMERVYFDEKRTSPTRIGRFAREYFGPYAGYAQQYLYHYWRNESPSLQIHSCFEKAPPGGEIG